MTRTGATRFVVRFGSIALVLVTLCVLFADRHWIIELFSHYRPHLALGAVALAVIGLISRHYVIGTMMLMLALFHASVLIVHWAPHPVVASAGQSLRAVSLNLGKVNRRIDLVRSLIEREKPALLALTEIDREELAKIAPSVSDYHRADFIDDSGFGVALFSRDPIRAAQMIMLGGEPFPALQATIDRAGKEISVIVAHPPPPIDERWALAHRRQIDALHQVLVGLGDASVIVLADLNTSPWAPAYKRLTHGLALNNAAVGFPYAPTWPAGLGVLGIPIDYCLTSPGIPVLRYRAGPDVGSDHRPVIVDLLL